MKLITSFLFTIFTLIQLQAQHNKGGTAVDQNGNIYVAAPTSDKLKYGGKTILSNKQNKIVLLKIDRQGQLINQLIIDSTTSEPCFITVEGETIFAGYKKEEASIFHLFSADLNFETTWHQEIKMPKNDGIISFETDGDELKIGFKLSSKNEATKFGIALLKVSKSKKQQLEIVEIDKSLGFYFNNDATTNDWSYETDDNSSVSVDEASYFNLINNSMSSDYDFSSEIISGSFVSDTTNSSLFYLQKGQISAPIWSLKSNPEHSAFGTDYTIGVDGSVFAVGTFENLFRVDESALMSGGSLDAFILKANADGQLKWMMNFGGDHEDMAISITKTSYNDLLFAIAMNCTSTNANQTLLICIDQDGNVLWQNQILSSK